MYQRYIKLYPCRYRPVSATGFARRLHLLGVFIGLKLLPSTVLHHKRTSEISMRLGEISESSLLIAVLALELSIIGKEASYVIQLATLLTFIVSSYIIVQRYPTPIAINDKLRRD